ncbi:LEA type 2 family protein [bacterium]|nr:LEA type 2 family protein [bacterium]
MKILAICLLFLFPAIGCTPTITKLEIVRIANIRLDSVTPEILTMRAELAIRNPYSSSARLKNISLDLALVDQFIAYGKLTKPVDLEGNSVSVIDVPLALQCKKVTSKDFEALLSREIPYRIQGSAELERPFGPKTLPIQIKNRMNAPGRLQILLKHKSALSILSLEANGTRQLLFLIRNKRLKVRFNNPFAFPLTIQDLRYEVKLGKDVVADGESESYLTLVPGKNHLELGVKPRPMGAVEGLFKGFLDRQLPDFTLSSEFRIARENRDLLVRLIYSPD